MNTLMFRIRIRISLCLFYSLFQFASLCASRKFSAERARATRDFRVETGDCLEAEGR